MTSKRDLRAMVERLTAQLEIANAERDAADKRARATSVDLCIAQAQCHLLKVDLKAANDRAGVITIKHVPGRFSDVLFNARRTFPGRFPDVRSLSTPDEAA
jgi:hypothetical protein